MLPTRMRHPFHSSSSMIRGRDEDTEEVYPSPVDTYNGSFTFPRTWPLSFRETSSINITWSTLYESVNLYYYQSGKVATSIQITTNQAREWYQWEVETVETNLTLPFVFRIVNAWGTDEEKLYGGFWSTSFYIVRDALPSTASALLPSSTLSESSLAAFTVAFSATTSSTTTSSAAPTPTTSLSRESPSATAIQVPQDNNKELGSAAMAGISIAAVGGVAMFAAAYVLYKKLRARHRPAVQAAIKPPMPTGLEQPKMQEIYTSPPELTSTPIPHELSVDNMYLGGR